MGNHADADDYRLYARPQDGQAQDSVHIVDDGGPAPSAGRAGGAGGASEAGAGEAGGRGTNAAGAGGAWDSVNSAAGTGEGRTGRDSVNSAAGTGEGRTGEGRTGGDSAAGNIAATRRLPGGSGSGNGTSGRQAGSARAEWAEDLGDPTGTDGVQGPEAPGGFAASDGPRRRFNPYLCAAWALVAVMLATGMSWLTGALEPTTYFSVDPSTGQGMEGGPGVIASNLYGMGPFVLLFGLLGALTLLTVQAAAFRRSYGR
ncbi:hypothetical protein [Arthrobacter luteolus]|nr:hypothetical protein [Arthrobacter luteolus]